MSHDVITGTPGELSGKREEHSGSSVLSQEEMWASSNSSWPSNVMGIHHHLLVPVRPGVIASGLLWIVHFDPLPFHTLFILYLRPT